MFVFIADTNLSFYFLRISDQPSKQFDEVILRNSGYIELYCYIIIERYIQTIKHKKIGYFSIQLGYCIVNENIVIFN